MTSPEPQRFPQQRLSRTEPPDNPYEPPRVAESAESWVTPSVGPMDRLEALRWRKEHQGAHETILFLSLRKLSAAGLTFLGGVVVRLHTLVVSGRSVRISDEVVLLVVIALGILFIAQGWALLQFRSWALRAVRLELVVWALAVAGLFVWIAFREYIAWGLTLTFGWHLLALILCVLIPAYVIGVGLGSFLNPQMKELFEPSSRRARQYQAALAATSDLKLEKMPVVLLAALFWPVEILLLVAAAFYLVSIRDLPF